MQQQINQLIMQIAAGSVAAAHNAEKKAKTEEAKAKTKKAEIQTQEAKKQTVEVAKQTDVLKAGVEAGLPKTKREDFKKLIADAFKAREEGKINAEDMRKIIKDTLL